MYFFQRFGFHFLLFLIKLISMVARTALLLSNPEYQSDSEWIRERIRQNN
ncbi:unnamed protein product [Dracunculus medinensis]|uniref:Uncharacterized protein n=1 Tax=Dracunculus medinensis TaxID=318479 RepID=A0A3P7QAF8_DRAME|nr:unnamed protein product [Dracunculus medinensis]